MCDNINNNRIETMTVMNKQTLFHYSRRNNFLDCAHMCLKDTVG